MVNFSDGKTDGLVLMYAKDGKIYPVLVKQSELEMLDLIITTALTGIAPLFGRSVGTIDVIGQTARGCSR